MPGGNESFYIHEQTYTKKLQVSLSLMYNLLLPHDFKELAEQLSRVALQKKVFCMQKSVQKHCKSIPQGLSFH